MAIALYGAPNEGKIYGMIDADVTDAWDFITRERAKGKRITMTHVVTAAIGRAMGLHVPEVNVFVRRGKLVQREDMVVTVAVNMKDGAEMTNIKVRGAHQKTVFEIGQYIRERAARARGGDEGKTAKNKYVLGNIPWPFRRGVFVFIRWIFTTLGISLPFMGLKEDSFGSMILSNIGSHGLSIGMGALMPAARLPGVIIMGREEEKPVVRDGEIVIRKILPLAGTFDHRVMDGYHAGVIAHHLRRYLENPELLAVPPEEAAKMQEELDNEQSAKT